MRPERHLLAAAVTESLNPFETSKIRIRRQTPENE